MKTKKYIELENKYGANNYKPLDIVLSRGQGVWVYDVDNKKYMDFLAAYSAVNQGHCHKGIIKAVKDQLNNLTLTSRAFRTDKLSLFYKKLSDISGFEKVLPMNTGAEAVESAIKLARKWGYTKKHVEQDKAEIIVCANNFHGRTTTIIGFSTEEQYKFGFGPFTPGFKIINFGDADALEKAITKNTVAFLTEPIQGEGGIVVAKKGFLKKAREICTKNNVLLMIDEIQSGLGRTGKMFAYEHENICPDVLILGKALSGGVYPVSVVLADSQYMDVFGPGDHGSTYGGNPVAAAASLAALGVIEKENLVEKSEKLGEYLMSCLKSLNSDKIKEIRGAGLWIGIELKDEAGGARKYCEKLKDMGLLVKETHENVIRLAPPLVIKKKELDWAINKLKQVLNNK